MFFLSTLFETSLSTIPYEGVIGCNQRKEGVLSMKQLYIKQKVFSLSGRFTVKDQQEKDIYFVEGSFMKIPKSFTIKNSAGTEVALITKKTFSFLPKFYVEVNGHEVLTINKEFSFFKSRYSIDAANIEVKGNWWNMDFEIFQNGEMAGKVNKEWFTWGDSYKVQILKEEMETIVIALVIAIDCVKSDQAAASSAAGAGAN